MTLDRSSIDDAGRVAKRRSAVGYGSADDREKSPEEIWNVLHQMLRDLTISLHPPEVSHPNPHEGRCMAPLASRAPFPLAMAVGLLLAVLASDARAQPSLTRIEPGAL